MKQISQLFGIACLLLAGPVLAVAESKVGAEPGKPAATAAETLAQKWGVEIASVRLSAQGNLVDFRYKVLDADKAAQLADREAAPYLLDQATGAKLLVPRSPKIGPLRQTAQKPEVGKVYFTLFGNGGKAVKSGSKVAVVFGDCRIDNLTVQ